MKTPFFSILIPVYNVEKYVGDCIDSILKQQFSDYEIIIVDDGSTDNSPALCDMYVAENQEKIKVIHKNNEGLISARREALKLATGQYICFIDSDDTIDSNMLSDLYAVINKYQPDIVIFELSFVDELGRCFGSRPPLFETTGFVEKKEVYKRTLEKNFSSSLCARCYRTSIVDKNTDYRQYYYIKKGEDLLQSIPILEKAESFYYLGEKLYNYRTNPRSITHTYNHENYKGLDVTRPMLYESMQRMGYISPETERMFYEPYLNAIWDGMYHLFMGTDDKEIIGNALKTMKSYQYVKNARKYVDKCHLGKKQKLAVRMLYSNEKMLGRCMRAYKLAMKLKKKL